MAWTGFALASRSKASVVLIPGLLGVAYGRRITAEEQLLRRDLPGYAAYCQRTKRLVPFVWWRLWQVPLAPSSRGDYAAQNNRYEVGIFCRDFNGNQRVTGRRSYVPAGAYAIMRGQITEAERDYSVFSRLGGTPFSGRAEPTPARPSQAREAVRQNNLGGPEVVSASAREWAWPDVRSTRLGRGDRVPSATWRIRPALRHAKAGGRTGRGGRPCR